MSLRLKSTLPKWTARADKADFSQSNASTDELPTQEVFIKAICEAKGAAGFDGWSAAELKAVIKTFPKLGEKLYNIFTDVATTAAKDPHKIDEQLRAALFAWRVVGIPKKVADQSRPIAVAPFILRAWLSAAAKAISQPDSTQWAGRKQTAVYHATADWLADCADADAGINQAIAREGLTREGVPTPTIVVCNLAWTWPRWTHVDVEVCAEPL